MGTDIYTLYLLEKDSICIQTEVLYVLFHQWKPALNFENGLDFVLNEFVVLMFGDIVECIWK